MMGTANNKTLKLLLNTYIQILFHNMLLGLAAEFPVCCITLQVIKCLPRVEVHLRLPVYSLVVNLGRLSGGIFLDFAAVEKHKQIILV